MKMLDGKVVLVTGAGSGTGRAAAVLFAQEGATVILANRSEEKALETQQIIIKNGKESFFFKTDVSNEKDIIELIAFIGKKFGRLDSAFNCAGTDGVKKNITDILEAEFNEPMDINFKGTFFLLKHQIAQMIKQETGGTIVNMASVSGMLGRPQRAAYNASRAGIISLTKTAAIEYIKKNIRINCIAPAAINTDLFRKFTNNDPNIMKNYADAHPIGRLCEPEEVAEAALWLLSARSSFVVGHTLLIDGGFSLV